MAVRGIRGATTVEVNQRDAILDATQELLEEILQANKISHYEDIVSAIFTTSPDLTSCFPAEAARVMGMNEVPLLCASEIDVTAAMPMCIRVLLHLNTELRQSEMSHIYLRQAKKLRPDVGSAQ